MNVALRSLALAFALALVGACGGSARPATPTADPLAGRYTATGGGGAIAAVNALAKRFSESHPGVVFQIDETGSDAGVNLATSGGVDFGFTSRALTASEATQLSAVGIGLAGTTRGSFESYFFGGKATYVKDATEVFELEQTLKAVGSFGASIGMATASSRTVSETTVNVLTIDGVAPSPENLVNGTYKVGRPLLIVVPSDAAKVKPAIKAFLDFVRSPEGQKLAASTY
ncbi:MAG: hypothetical protein E6I57_10080 [Chloroflexi bacterium]|nr:MAG: hypothetical protein E6I57_10080 [Chloroflexota bacterium]